MKSNQLSKPQIQSSAPRASFQNVRTAGLCGLLLWLVPLYSWADDFTALDWTVCHACETPVVRGTNGWLYGTSLIGVPGFSRVFGFNGGCRVLKEFSFHGTSYVAGPLLISGDVLYGTVYGGDSSGGGLLYRINTDGNGYAVLKDFTNAISDGAQPRGGMTLSGETLYGTTEYGGTYGCGVVFKMSTSGSNYAVLKYFNGSDGANPEATLLLSGSVLYGTTYGTTNSGGTVFKINTDGSGFQVLKAFAGTWTGPRAGLALSGTNLYGTTFGGVWTHGCVFRLGTDGSGYTVLKQFTGPDGSMPRGDLLLRGNWLFGTTASDTTYSRGTIFKVNTDGSHFVKLHQFYESTYVYWGSPYAGLILVGNDLYGTCFYSGCLFRLGAPSPPTILSSPLTQTAETGQEVDFRADAAGSPPFGYQLLFDGRVIAASTSPTIRLMKVQPSQSGLYSVVVTNLYDAVTSSPAMLNVIPSVGRRIVPSILLGADAGTTVRVDYSDSINPAPSWATLDSVTLTSTSQYYLDATAPLPPQRFYRAWQSGTAGLLPSVRLSGMVPAITLTGNVGDKLRVDYINQVGPTDAWVTLDTLTLTNTSQLYFDISSIGQPRRLYRIVPVP